MKKSKIKFAVKNAIDKFYSNVGLTNTGDRLRSDLLKAIDKEYSKKHS